MRRGTAVVALLVVGSACAGDRHVAPPSLTAAASSTTTTPVPATTTSPPPATTTARAPAPVPSAPRLPLVGKVIVIDPGHNGGNAAHAAEINQLVDAVTEKKPCDTTGTATADGYTESAYNFDVAQRLARALRVQGAQVVLTRQSDAGWGPCITERAAIANRAGAAVAISIHADGGPSPGRGFHVIEPALIAGYTDAIVGPSQRLALDVRRQFQAATTMPFATYIGSQGLDTRSDLGGLNLSKVPKVFIETGNMANRTDAAQLEDPAFRAKAAAGLAAALEDFLRGL